MAMHCIYHAIAKPMNRTKGKPIHAIMQNGGGQQYYCQIYVKVKASLQLFLSIMYYTSLFYFIEVFSPDSNNKNRILRTKLRGFTHDWHVGGLST